MKIDKSVVKSFSIFEKMPDSDIEALLAQAATKRIGPGEAFFDQGSSATHFFLLVHGGLR